MKTTPARRRGLIAALGALALVAPAEAGASLLSGSTTQRAAGELSRWSAPDEERSDAVAVGADAGCPDAPLSQRFAAWSDPADYKLAPGGDFEEGGAGWLLTGGAAVARDGNTLGTAGHAVVVPGGASVTSPPVCIAPGSPVARGFAMGAGGGLHIELLDEGGGAKSAGVLAPQASWDATRRFSLSQGHYLGSGKAGVAWLRLRFTADPGSSWRIDDVYVDPRSFG